MYSILQAVCWPEQEEDDSDSEYLLATKLLNSGFLRQFIETGNLWDILGASRGNPTFSVRYLI